MNITLDNMSKVYQAGKSSVDTMELKGYELVKELFTDSSGLGAPGEPALTLTQFETELTSLLTEHGKLTAKITGVGQFQVFVGLFKRTGKSRVKKIANNTLLIDYGNGKRAIRLHDTDILTEQDGKITLDNGGFATRTTHARMNEFLPSNTWVYGKNYQTWLNDKPLVNGTSIKGTLNI